MMVKIKKIDEEIRLGERRWRPWKREKVLPQKMKKEVVVFRE